MPNANGQHTDAENSKPLGSSTPIQDDVKQVSSQSAQKIAQDRGNQNTQSGSGGENPGASIT